MPKGNNKSKPAKKNSRKKLKGTTQIRDKQRRKIKPPARFKSALEAFNLKKKKLNLLKKNLLFIGIFL